MAYVDGFVIPVPKKNIAAYKKIAKKAGKIWMDHGAINYVETALEDSKPPMGIPFLKTAQAKPGEIVVFSWITYKSRAHRDKVNAKVMKDPRMQAMMDPNDKTFDCNRITYGGFDVLVDM